MLAGSVAGRQRVFAGSREPAISRHACYIAWVPRKHPHVYRFKLSDREFAAAWLREYYRRAGLRIIRVLAGPGLVALGVVMRGSSDGFTRIMGLVTIVFGVWLAVKPLLMAWAFTSRRRRARRGEVEIEVRLDGAGMSVTDGEKTTELPWDRIAAAGLADRYVWLELKTGTRATIPRRAIDDLHALRELVEARVEWRG